MSESRPIDAPSTVLVIDPLEETRQVLQTVLERRGVRIVTARRADEGLRLFRQHHPDVVVLDHEASSVGGDGASARDAIDRDAHDTETPLLVLSAARPASPCSTSLHVRKPYHYGPLIHTIETLLARRKAG